MLVVINGGENAQRLGKEAPVDSDILFAIKRQQNIVTFKWLSDALGFRVGITQAFHVGNDNEQHIVALAHRFGNRLNPALLRFFHQPLADLRRVRQRSGHGQRLVCQRIARHVADL